MARRAQTRQEQPSPRQRHLKDATPGDVAAISSVIRMRSPTLRCSGMSAAACSSSGWGRRDCSIPCWWSIRMKASRFIVVGSSVVTTG